MVGVVGVAGVEAVVVVVLVVVVGVVGAVVVGGEAAVTEGDEVGTDAAVGVEEELPQPATASAVRTSGASRDRRRRTAQTVAQAPPA